MSAEEDLPERYQVVATRRAIDDGKKIIAQEKNRLWLISELLKLRHWPDNADEFYHQKVFGAIKFDFDVEDKWIRVFVYQDEARKVMWILRGFAKKTNKLTTAQQISVETAVGRIEHEIELFKQQLQQAKKQARLGIIKGGGAG